MVYLIAALVIVLAMVVTVAVAKFVFGLLVLAAALVAGVYVWYRLKDAIRRPHAGSPAEEPPRRAGTR